MRRRNRKLLNSVLMLLILRSTCLAFFVTTNSGRTPTSKLQLTGEEIRERLHQQLQRLKEKDRKSRLLEEQVCLDN